MSGSDKCQSSLLTQIVFLIPIRDQVSRKRTTSFGHPSGGGLGKPISPLKIRLRIPACAHPQSLIDYHRPCVNPHWPGRTDTCQTAALSGQTHSGKSAKHCFTSKLPMLLANETGDTPCAFAIFGSAPWRRNRVMRSPLPRELKTALINGVFPRESRELTEAPAAKRVSTIAMACAWAAK
jgi:hypothetical protein